MASDQAIQKMIHAIMDKRRKLGLVDWGVLPPEVVLAKINQQGEQEKSTQTPSENLADDELGHHNNER